MHKYSYLDDPNEGNDDVECKYHVDIVRYEAIVWKSLL
jgi:hypothetical protein